MHLDVTYISVPRPKDGWQVQALAGPGARFFQSNLQCVFQFTTDMLFQCKMWKNCKNMHSSRVWRQTWKNQYSLVIPKDIADKTCTVHRNKGPRELLGKTLSDGDVMEFLRRWHPKDGIRAKRKTFAKSRFEVHVLLSSRK